ncbi:MAG: universal stress protein [Silicimonas sp.]|nr:universal stress protein [Silicimonas sp.]
MGYKTLVTMFRNPELDGAHLAAALELAEREGAHLNVLALGIERLPPETYFGGGTSILVQGAMSDALDDLAEAEAGAKAVLDNTTVPWGMQTIAAPVGSVAQVLARFAALSDLVVMPQPYGPGRNAEDVAVVEAALFSSRTPMLVMPKGASSCPDGKKIVIAWNQSTEALAAIRAALPMLKRAAEVDIAVVDPSQADGMADPGTQLAELLSRHGVTVEISVVAKTMPKVSEVILRHIDDLGADMLVMGAYGHSRFRESILGGTTRNMLEESEVPVLMAH